MAVEQFRWSIVIIIIARAVKAGLIHQSLTHQFCTFLFFSFFASSHAWSSLGAGCCSGLNLRLGLDGVDSLMMMIVALVVVAVAAVATAVHWWFSLSSRTQWVTGFSLLFYRACSLSNHLVGHMPCVAAPLVSMYLVVSEWGERSFSLISFYTCVSHLRRWPPIYWVKCRIATVYSSAKK